VKKLPFHIALAAIAAILIASESSGFDSLYQLVDESHLDYIVGLMCKA
jgi:hypothetical protein